MNCPACQTEIAPGQTFCPTCRARGSPPFATQVVTPVAKRIAPPPDAHPAPAPERSDKNERLFLVVSCLLAAGALTIPRLMRSRAFGPTGKLVLGVGAFVNTAGALAIIVYLVVKGPELLQQYVRYIQNR